jgi:hypothetical protein
MTKLIKDFQVDNAVKKNNQESLAPIQAAIVPDTSNPTTIIIIIIIMSWN